MADIDGKPLSLADLSPKAGPVLLDVAQLVPHTDSSRVLIQGNPLGASVTSIRRTAESLVLTEQSSLGSAFEQQTTRLLARADGTGRRLDQVTTQQGKQSETHLTYVGGRVKGRSVAPQPDGSMKPFDIDTMLPPGTMDENAVAFVVPALPLAAGKTFTLSLFTPSEGSTKLLTFKVRTPESITVPAGTFQAYRIDVTGSRVPFVMHVSTDTPRRVVKTEFVGQPFAVELVK